MTMRILRGVLASVALLWAPAVARSQTADFYAGKTIEVIVAVSAGGGYDTYARLLTRHMGRHIPGAPAFVIQNMPGAGGVRAANHLFNIASKDGTVIGTITRELPLLPLLEPGNTGPRFDARRFNWIGSPQQETGLFVLSARAGVRSLEDMGKREIPVSSTGPGSAPSVFPRVLSDIFGWRFKIIEGYPGSQEALQAIETGEVDGHTSGGSSAAFRARIQPWIASKQASVFLQMGFRKDDAFPEAPLALELAKSESDRQLLELILTPQLMGRPFLAPPDAPQERIAILRSAFSASMKDEKLLAEAQKLGMDIQPVNGDEIARVLDKVYRAPPELIQRAQKVLK
jgi:tripartite-type tricarboxylate transporter receptor subunit TctC